MPLCWPACTSIWYKCDCSTWSNPCKCFCYVVILITFITWKFSSKLRQEFDISVNSSVQSVITFVFGYIFLKHPGIVFVTVDLDAHIGKILMCICKESNYVINIRLTQQFDILKFITTSSTGNTHLNQVKVENNYCAEFKILDCLCLFLMKYRIPYLMNPNTWLNVLVQYSFSKQQRVLNFRKQCIKFKVAFIQSRFKLRLFGLHVFFAFLINIRRQFHERKIFSCT